MKAKSTLIVATCLYPDEALLHFELWRVCCHSADSKRAASVLDQVCKSDVMITSFSSKLVADLQQPGAVCGRGWLQAEAVSMEKLVDSCLSQVAVAISKTDANTDTQSENHWQLIMRLAQLTNDHPSGVRACKARTQIVQESMHFLATLTVQYAVQRMCVCACMRACMRAFVYVCMCMYVPCASLRSVVGRRRARHPPRQAARRRRYQRCTRHRKQEENPQQFLHSLVASYRQHLPPPHPPPRRLPARRTSEANQTFARTCSAPPCWFSTGFKDRPHR
jgi:hypothetical protein